MFDTIQKSKSTLYSIPTVIANRYELITKLASGGMASIYLGRFIGTPDFERLVAVKIIHPHLTEDEEFVNMFLDEATITAKLSHPNIAQVIELGEQDGLYYMIMEYVEGETLNTLINRIKKRNLQPLTYAQAAWIVSQAASGLYYAHTLTDPYGKPLSIIHRDVTPQNIMITYEGHIKLIDFGIARALGRRTHTKTGEIKGKYSYMSPEQVRGQKIDARSDIFSLGVVLYEITLLNRLFKRDTELATIQAILNYEVVPPSHINPRYPRMLESIVLKAISQEPKDRYQTAKELVDDLEYFISSTGEIVGSHVISRIMKNVFEDKIKIKETLKKLKPKESSIQEVSEEKERSLSTKSDRSLFLGSKNIWIIAGLLLVITLTIVFIINSKYPAKKEIPFKYKITVPIEKEQKIKIYTPQNNNLEIPKREESKEPKAVTNGVLSLFSEPTGAKVYINGEYKGDTPITIGGLPIKKEINIKLTKEGYEEVTKNIKLFQNKENIIIELSSKNREKTKVRSLDAPKKKI